MAKIGYTRWVCGQNRVPLYFSDRNDPRAPSHWPAPATTRRWAQTHRVYPTLATQPPRGTRLLHPPTRKWPAVRPQRPNSPPRTSRRLLPSSSKFMPPASPVTDGTICLINIHPSSRQVSMIWFIRAASHTQPNLPPQNTAQQ